MSIRKQITNLDDKYALRFVEVEVALFHEFFRMTRPGAQSKIRNLSS